MQLRLLGSHKNMSRNFNNWGRGRSKPSSRSRGRQWGNQQYNVPRGLRGKEIGLYFRDQNAKKQKKDPTINLKIPAMVLAALDNNLKHAIKLAAQKNILLPKFDQLDIFKNNTSIAGEVNSETCSDSDDYNTVSQNNSVNYKCEAGPSGTDFIPNKEGGACRPNTKLLALRKLCDYKYGYEDIITGTFEEKLDECLSNGVSINLVDSETQNLNTALFIEYQDMLESNDYIQMLKFREKLPAYIKAEHIIDKINQNQIMVISGETGCGKSTQVPQIILDDAIRKNRGANTKVLVTQPRRIAASALATRVSKERGEILGHSVGYAVRLERAEERPRGSIQYCTTGILLAELEVNQGLTKYSHIILDEVHERDVHVDFSMCILKQVLKKRKDLKLILMSATLDAESLSRYFDNCPMMHIEGLAFPVEDIYLEDILHITKFRLPPEVPKKQQPKWMKYRNKNAADDMEKDILYKREIWPWLESLKDKLSYDVYKILQDSRVEDLSLELIVELLIYICKGKPGAILVFLPGIGEITKLMRLMNESNRFPSNHFEIHPLHSKLPTLEQHKIFERPPESVRKIIIATNIAETSITIDDIVYVIDCGKIKLSGLNVEKNQSTLAVEWVSKANLHQRRGRAGRCQPGICYHLLTSYRASVIQDRLSPELQRSDLLEPVLMIKRLRLGMVADALKDFPSVPADSTICWAIKHLQKCGALDDTETLTALGWHLARLPAHPAAGKLLLLGALFGCLDRAASVAAVWGFKDPFQLVIGKESKVDKAKRDLAMGEPSDHIAISEAIIQWENCSYRNKRSFAYDNFLSNNTLQLLSEMKHQFGQHLKQMGFLSSGNIRSEWENRNAYNLSLFKAIVAASLYPNVAHVKWRNLHKPRITARFSARNAEDGRLAIHPSSVMAMPKIQKGCGFSGQLCNNPGANWLVYWLKQRSTELFLLDVTMIYTLPLLFFGEFMVCDDVDDPDHCLLSITNVKVRCQRESAHKLFELRCLLDKVLASKITDSSNNSVQYNEFEEQVLNTVIQLITAEDEQAEYIDDYQDSDTSEN